MSRTQQPFVSVVVPVKNDAERLKKCLRALEAQTYPADRYEIVVADNGSDESIEPVVTQFPHATATSQPKTGPAAARNKGIELAQGHVIAFTDADCIPEPDWLTNGVAALLRVPNCGLVAGRIDVFPRDPDNVTAIEVFERITGFKQLDYIMGSHFGATANVFTLRSVIDEVGGFDETFTTPAAEDLEWGRRVFKAGYTLYYADDARILHPARATFEQMHRQIKIRLEGNYRLHRREKLPDYVLDMGDYRRKIVPNLRLIHEIYTGKRFGDQLHTIKERTLFLIGINFVRYAEIYEKLRLRRIHSERQKS